MKTVFGDVGGKSVKFRSSVVAIVLPAVLGGCATAGFSPPAYVAPTDAQEVSFDAQDPEHVSSYARGAISTYDRMLRNSERVKFATELPIIGAAVAAPLSLAIGNHTNRAIYLAGAGAAGGALSGYLDMRTRSGYVAKARSATTCINREYVNQIVFAKSLAKTDKAGIVSSTSTLATDLIDEAAPIKADITGAGPIAVAAVDDVISNLKLRLADLGTAPDYSAILADVKAKQTVADKKTEESQALANTKAAAVSAEYSKEAIEYLAGYQVRITECVAKLP